VIIPQQVPVSKLLTGKKNAGNTVYAYVLNIEQRMPNRNMNAKLKMIDRLETGLYHGQPVFE
jgi:hypothetical protein